REGRVDQPYVRVRLRVVAPESRCGRVEILRQKAQGRERAARPLEHLTRLGGATDGDQRLDVPEGAENEGHRRRPEAVAVVVAEQPPVLGETPADRVDAGSQARIVVRQEVELRHLEQRRVEVTAALGGDE